MSMPAKHFMSQTHGIKPSRLKRAQMIINENLKKRRNKKRKFARISIKIKKSKQRLLFLTIPK